VDSGQNPRIDGDKQTVVTELAVTASHSPVCVATAGADARHHREEAGWQASCQRRQSHSWFRCYRNPTLWSWRTERLWRSLPDGSRCASCREPRNRRRAQRPRLLDAVKATAAKAGVPYERFIRQALENAVQPRKGP